MRFEILGPLAIRSEYGSEVVVRSRNERTLLAALLLRAGQPVRVEYLVEALWPDGPPASCKSNLHTYLSRLRDRLPGTTIDHANGCYQLLGPVDLDLLEFREEARAGRAALERDDPVAAVVHLRRALRRWRGHPLDSMSVVVLEADIVKLEAERLAVVEDRITAEFAVAEADGASGAGQPGHGDVEPVAAGHLISELQHLVAEYPLRERLRIHLMIALWRAGRRADALSAYHDARKTLVTELGIEPCPQLQRLHQAILRGEAPAATRQRRKAVTDREQMTDRKAVFPVCQLPPPVTGFVGRAGVIARVCDLIAPTTTTVPVVVISGHPGVGKSALAVFVAHRMRTMFPDGQLFSQLGGLGDDPGRGEDTGPDERSGAVGDPPGRGQRNQDAVLADLLQVLGVPAAAVPRDRVALTAAYRSRLADRRVLVVLDDAADPEQVRALTPGTPGNAVLVTSRSRLSGLTDAIHVPLGPLDDAEARELLVRAVGLARGTREQAQVRRIAAACGNLPLALRIAGTRLATRGLRLAAFADRLDDERRRLPELAVSDQQVRASIGLSVAALSSPAREAFTLLGVVGPVSFSAWTVAALIGCPDVDVVIDELVEANLLDPVPAEPDGVAAGGLGGDIRYQRHDLLRVYAEDLVVAMPDQGACARLRLLAWAIALAETAARHTPRVLTWSRLTTETGPAGVPASGGSGGVPASGGPGGVPASGGSALDTPVASWAEQRAAAEPLAWFAAERQVLVWCVAEAYATGADQAATLLAERIAPYLWTSGLWIDLDQVRRHASLAAYRSGQERVRLLMAFIEGVLQLVRGDLPDAAVSFAASSAGFQRLGDQHGLACVLSDQAVLYDYQNRAADAERVARAAVELFRASDDEVGTILASPGLSAALRWLGRLDEARATDHAALAAARRTGAAPVVLARCLNALALSQLLGNASDQAYVAAHEACGLLRSTGDRYVLLAALRNLALAAVGLGRRSEAIELLERSHRLAAELGDRLWAVGLERDIAVSWIAEGRSADAVGVLCRCLRAFHEMRFRSGQSTTLGALARAYDELGRVTAARAARCGATRLADPGDLRTPQLAAVVLRLAEPVAEPARGSGC